MTNFVSKELEELLNPLPKSLDPEDDENEPTRAKVIDTFEEEEGIKVGVSFLRKCNALQLSDTDRRYVGKAVSRKQLLIDYEGSCNERDVNRETIELIDDEEDDDDDEDDGGSDEHDEEPTEENDYDDDDNDDDVGDIDIKQPRSLKVVDFHKLTEGFTDSGMKGINDNSETDEDSSVKQMGQDEDNEAVRTFNQHKFDEEMEKSQAVKNQLTLWDQLLEGRIKIQKALLTANQLPQPNTFDMFRQRGGPELQDALKNSHKALKALQRSLLDLHNHLLLQGDDIKAIAEGESRKDDGVVQQNFKAYKHKLEMAEYPDFMSKRFSAFRPYRDATLQKWHDKTRLTTGKSSKGFGAFDRNILTQVEQVLMDQERLLHRTQSRRSDYIILGKMEAVSAGVEAEENNLPQRVNQHLKDLDEDIFDDDDFYHQLLRELIECKTSAADPNDQVAVGRQWLAIQKLRSKVKKKVDTKASKGRKIRFHIHNKLINFMAPIDHSNISDEACNELYRGLFGQNASGLECAGGN